MQDKNSDPRHRPEQRLQEPFVLRLPGFLVDEDTGLGDAIKRVTYAMGIKACDGCGRRAEALNSWIRFSR
jgi:hypothetical protein